MNYIQKQSKYMKILMCLLALLLQGCARDLCEQPRIEYVTVYPAWVKAGENVADELDKLCENPANCRYLEMWLNDLYKLSQILQNNGTPLPDIERVSEENKENNEVH